MPRPTRTTETTMLLFIIARVLCLSSLNAHHKPPTFCLVASWNLLGTESENLNTAVPALRSTDRGREGCLPGLLVGRGPKYLRELTVLGRKKPFGLYQTICIKRVEQGYAGAEVDKFLSIEDNLVLNVTFSWFVGVFCFLVSWWVSFYFTSS